MLLIFYCKFCKINDGANLSKSGANYTDQNYLNYSKVSSVFMLKTEEEQSKK